jgi:two-component system nitrogen regulation response regulator GlnG
MVNAQRSILVIDDEESICLAFRRFFERRGWAVHVTASGLKGIDLYRQARPTVVFLDVRLPDSNGLDVLAKLRAEDPHAHVIIITAHGSLAVVMQAVQGKAFDYLVKPLDLDQAEQLALRAAEAPPAEVASVGHAPAAPDGAVTIVGASPVMQEVYKRIALVAQSDAAVLILGPTGTGKELVARAIHRHGGRKDKPFVAIHCGALPEHLIESELFGHVRGAFTGADSDQPGRFEVAQGGTILLDEAGELPPAAQVKLLRVLDTHTVERVGSTRPIPLDVRILAATNRPLAADVRSGRFRSDLYYRLAVMQIELPPLADRGDDVLPLAKHFLAEAAGAGRPVPPISPEAAETLQRYAWPGNVRELKNAMEHAFAIARQRAILPADLPEAVRGLPDGLAGAPPGDGPDRLAQMVREYLASLPPGEADLYRRVIEPAEKAVIRHALHRCRGNQSEAAALLGLHRNTLRNKLRELGLDAGEAH